MVVSALQIMAAQGDATANKAVEDWPPLSIYFSLCDVVNFILAFALKQGYSGVAGSVLSEQI